MSRSQLAAAVLTLLVAQAGVAFAQQPPSAGFGGPPAGYGQPIDAPTARQPARLPAAVRGAPAASRGYYDPGPRLRDMSWTYQQIQEARRYARHDMVFIAVSETAQSTSEAEVQRRKNAIYDAALEEWVRWVRLFTLKPAVQRDGDLQVNGNLNQVYRSEGDTETRESIQLKITAEVADILPNGNLVLEAHRTIRVNNSVFSVSLSGICDPEDIAADRSIRSERILNLQLTRENRGVERDATKRGWLTLFMDEFNPF